MAFLHSISSDEIASLLTSSIGSRLSSLQDFPAVLETDDVARPVLGWSLASS